MNKDYTIGIYIRLSMADEDTGNGSKATATLTTIRRFPNIRDLSSRMMAIPGQIFIVLSSRR